MQVQNVEPAGNGLATVSCHNQADTPVVFNDPSYDEELKMRLKLYETKLSQMYEEIGQLYELRGHVHRMLKTKYYRRKPQHNRSLLHLGMNFFMSVEETEMTRININVGLECWVEFTIEEAMPYIQSKIHELQEQSQKFRDETCKIRSMARYGPLDTWHVPGMKTNHH